MTPISDENRSTAIQLWIIGALLPISFYFIGDSDPRDFDILWVAASRVLSGNPSEIYDENLLAAATGLPWPDGAIFPYPPHTILVLLPIALLQLFPAYLAWNMASLALFYWAARPYMPLGLPPVLAILTPASLICLDYGQTGLLLGAFWLFAFRGKWAAVALLTFKPHLGFLSILSIRSGFTLVRIILLALLLIAASVCLFGQGLWIEFIEQSTEQGARIGAMQRWLFQGVAPAIGYGFLGWIPFAVAGVLLLARNVNAFTASTASFLISPYGFNYDMTAASLGFGLVVASHWRAMPIRHRAPIVIGYLSPVIAIGGAWWVPPLLIWSLWAQTKYDVARA